MNALCVKSAQTKQPELFHAMRARKGGCVLDRAMTRQGRLDAQDVYARLEALQTWSVSRLNAYSDGVERLAAAVAPEITALLSEAHAASDRARGDLGLRVEALSARVVCLRRRERLEWALEWVRAYGDLCADLSPNEVEVQLAELLSQAALTPLPPDLDDRVRAALALVATMDARVAWERVLARVRAHDGVFPPNENINEGWIQLRAALGDRVWSRPFAGFVNNTIAENVIAHGRLGLMLHRAEGRTGYQKIIDSLLGDESALQAVLAELGVLWTLRGNGADADMLLILGEERGDSLCADIRVHRPCAFDIEVSYLGDAATWMAALDLNVRLERGVLAVVADRAPLFIRVRCSGYAASLLRHVPEACEQLRQRLSRERPWKEELVPGIGFEVVDGNMKTQVHVSGATVYAEDPTASEGPLRRLPPKVEHEASQVPTGGVVLICTSQLHFQLRAESDYEALASDLRNVGERMTNVAAFAVLDCTRGGETSASAYRDLGHGATLGEAATSLGSQRLLWVPNPSASRPIDAEKTRKLFQLPFGLYA
jgi:hypothetical protein